MYYLSMDSGDQKLDVKRNEKEQNVTDLNGSQVSMFQILVNYLLLIHFFYLMLLYL
jgi:hypothetical protein